MMLGKIIFTLLDTLGDFIKEGKIKHIGLSNETPWGIMRFLEESKHHNLPRIKTVQNPYSLLNRLYETGSAEIGYRKRGFSLFSNGFWCAIRKF
jgi:aryl-alcohol dehydrogenase-like predicted oxidoreductase